MSEVNGMLLGGRYQRNPKSKGSKGKRKRLVLMALALLVVVGAGTYGATQLLYGNNGDDAEQAAGDADGRTQADSRYSPYGSGGSAGAANVRTPAAGSSSAGVNTSTADARGASSAPPASSPEEPASRPTNNNPAADGSASAATGAAGTASTPAGTPDSTAAGASGASAASAGADQGQPGPLPQEARLAVAEAERHEQEGRLLQARAQYAAALPHASDRWQRNVIANKLAAISERTLLGPTIFQGDDLVEQYSVKSGDNLTAIGNRYRVPYEFIQRINRLPSDRLNVDQKLKIVRGPFSVKIYKSEFMLEVWRGDLLVKRFQIGVGSGDSTPPGRYEVLDKVKNPRFDPPPSQVGIMQAKAGGAPDNPIGSRWIKFAPSLGIHGTIEPDSIGRNASLGCIRMHNKEVEEVYDFLIRGSTVEIFE